MSQLDPTIAEHIEQLKEQGKYEEAVSMINHILAKNPFHKEALLHIADIQYRKGEISKAQKPIDFLIEKVKDEDPMSYYIKGVLEMEKTNRSEAKKYLKIAIKRSHTDNAEIFRCLGLCEYWSGNRERGIDLINDAFHLNKLDAEIVYNLAEIYILEHNYKKANTVIGYYYKNINKLQFFDKDIHFYNNKIKLFEKFLNQE